MSPARDNVCRLTGEKEWRAKIKTKFSASLSACHCARKGAMLADSGGLQECAKNWKLPFLCAQRDLMWFART